MVGGSPPETTRPNCRAKEAHSCWAFQVNTGSVRMQTSATENQSCQERSQRQEVGLHTSHRPIPAPTNKLVYLERRPRPQNRPMASHQLPLRELCSSATAQTASPQKSTEGVSGVMMTPPTASRGIASANQVARSARVRPNKMQPARHRMNGPSNEVIGAARRTPSALSPAVHIPAAIIHAVMGGWSK